MLRLSVFSLIVVGLLLVIDWSADAETSFNPVDMTEEEMDEFLRLAPLFADISKKLEKKLPKPEKPEENIAVAKELLSEIEKKKVVLGSRKLRDALRLFVSLEGVEEKCDLDGYKILSENYICIERNQVSKDRVQAVLDHYLTKHAEFCRDNYKKRYAEHVKEDELILLERILMSQDYEGFRCGEKAADLYYPELEMGSPSFIGRCALNARLRLARHIDVQVQKDPKLRNSVEIELYQLDGKSKVLNQVFDDYLFTPCQKFLDNLTSILSPARMDAAVKDSKQELFIGDGAKFYRAMLYNRYCRALLREKSQLYKLLAVAYAKEALL